MIEISKIDEEQLLTVKQAAQYFQTTEKTVRKWIKAGTLKAYTMPDKKTFRIQKKDILTSLQTAGANVREEA